MATYVLYGIWFLLPISFFCLFLWAQLEKWGGSRTKQNPGDFMRQGCFVTLVIALCMGIDQILFEANALALDWQTLWLLRVLLLPAGLYVASMVIGPSKDVKIAKAPDLSRGKRR
jgi:hypothetical protein